jgi:hypothetical protein
MFILQTFFSKALFVTLQNDRTGKYKHSGKIIVQLAAIK